MCLSNIKYKSNSEKTNALKSSKPVFLIHPINLPKVCWDITLIKWVKVTNTLSTIYHAPGLWTSVFNFFLFLNQNICCWFSKHILSHTSNAKYFRSIILIKTRSCWNYCTVQRLWHIFTQSSFDLKGNDWLIKFYFRFHKYVLFFW